MPTVPVELPRRTEFSCPGCGTRIAAVPILRAGVRHVQYQAHDRYGRVQAGQVIRACPRCGHELDRMPWSEFRDQVGQGFAP